MPLLEPVHKRYRGPWQFFIDRGGTFTDVIGINARGEIRVEKLLSEDCHSDDDACLAGIKRVLGLKPEEKIPAHLISVVKLGTTVATNALLERKGEPTVLVTNRGFRDALKIAYQNRPKIFARQIIVPDALYDHVIEVAARRDASGNLLAALARDEIANQLRQAYASGARAVAVVLMHSYRFPQEELAIERLARTAGFSQVSLSHEVSALIKLIPRGDTTVADAYLSPVLARYVERLKRELGDVPLLFMQSNGGLVDSRQARGKNSLFSGPAGGLVGAAETSMQQGLDKIIAFDMGGTSTDVSHFAGQYERTQETVIGGVRLNTPMIAINTVAAGGGSIVFFDGARLRVGPQSAGADPGPACYLKGGPLTVTDCNVLLGRIQPERFPSLFGAERDQPISKDLVNKEFKKLTDKINRETGTTYTAEQVAFGFISIANAKMANAIKQISIARGHDVREHALAAFGGAGGQHACKIAELLAIEKIIIHPLAGVLSAYGIGLSETRAIKQLSYGKTFRECDSDGLSNLFADLFRKCVAELTSQSGCGSQIKVDRRVHLKYEGTDSTLPVRLSAEHTVSAVAPQADIEVDIRLDLNQSHLEEEFNRLHEAHYGFTYDDKAIVIETLEVECHSSASIDVSGKSSMSGIGDTSDYSEEGESSDQPDKTETPERAAARSSLESHEQKTIERARAKRLHEKSTGLMYVDDHWLEVPIFERQALPVGGVIDGPCMIVDDTSTTVVENNWQVRVLPSFVLILEYVKPTVERLADTLTISRPDPVKLELFNHLFMTVAEEMGLTLQNTSSSVNIKERLDFSCALFDRKGNLVANAPHIPVHLGSMGESVKQIMETHKGQMAAGDAFVLNNPFKGGTHLPDITVISPVFHESSGASQGDPLFFVASRGHHADVGGITPGSMPAESKSLVEEGVVIDDFKLLESGRLNERELRALFNSQPYPARNIDQNVADLKAQVAANRQGIRELLKLTDHYGLEQVLAYMRFVQKNAESMVRRALRDLSSGSFALRLDEGHEIKVRLELNEDKSKATIDFTGTAPQTGDNLNAPFSVCRAAVLYVLRTLIDDDIPLNDGFMAPLELIVPDGCMLNPHYPAAVVAGNVETSQQITDALYAAMSVMAASQGTMNNFSFGNEQYQYYETIAGGQGAGNGFDGASAVQTNMTNSRLTDPEILETRFPVLLEEFSIRKDSGGRGRYRGGDGVVRRIKFLEEMTASILSERRTQAPYGMKGGQAGKPGRNFVVREGGEIEELACRGTTSLKPGETFVIETPGGGGFGTPN